MTEQFFRFLISACAVSCLIGAFILFFQAHLHGGSLPRIPYTEIVKKVVRFVLAKTGGGVQGETGDQTVIIFGLSGSGKTRLWQYLTLPMRSGSMEGSGECKVRPTVPSKDYAEGQLNLTLAHVTKDPLTPEDRLRMFGRIAVIDTPGSWVANPTKITEMIGNRNVIALIFCIDALPNPNFPRAAPAYFFDVLSSPEFQRKRPAVCMAVSRLSDPEAKRRNTVREDFERETERSYRQFLENVGSLRKATVPLAYPRSFIGRALYPMRKRWLQRKFEASQMERSRVRLVTEGNFFRFTNLDCLDKLLVQEDTEEVTAISVKSFILKVASKCRRR